MYFNVLFVFLTQIIWKILLLKILAPNKYTITLISKRGLLAINRLLIHNSFLTAKTIKNTLVLTSSRRSVTRYCSKIWWKKSEQGRNIRFKNKKHLKTIKLLILSYCQLVSNVNRIKRFFYGLVTKFYNECFDDCIFVDESTIELRKETYKKWRKNLPFQTINSSVGKPPHNVKIHVWAGIFKSWPYKNNTRRTMH